MTESFLMTLLKNHLLIFVAGLIVGSLFTVIVMHFFKRKTQPTEKNNEVTDVENTGAFRAKSADGDMTVNPYGVAQDGDTTVNPYGAAQDSDATVNPYGAAQEGEMTINPYVELLPCVGSSDSGIPLYSEEEEATVNPYAATWPHGIRVGIKVETPQITYDGVWNIKDSLQVGGVEDGLNLDTENTRLCRVLFTRNGRNLFAVGKSDENDAQPVLWNGKKLGNERVRVNTADVFEFESIRLTIESMG